MGPSNGKSQDLEIFVTEYASGSLVLGGAACMVPGWWLSADVFVCAALRYACVVSGWNSSSQEALEVSCGVLYLNPQEG